MLDRLERCLEPARHRHAPRTSAFGHRRLPSPLRALHRDEAEADVDVAPLQRHHLAASQPGVAAEQHHRPAAGIDQPRRLDERAVLVEVVERHRRGRHLHQLDLGRHGVDDAPAHRDLEAGVKHRQDVVHRLRRARDQPPFETLHVFIMDIIELLASEQRQEVRPEDALLGLHAARLLAVGAGVALHVPRLELAESRHLLALLLLQPVDEQEAFALLPPSQRRRLRRDGGLLAFPLHVAVRKRDHDIHLPASTPVGSHNNAHTAAPCSGTTRASPRAIVARRPAGIEGVFQCARRLRLDAARP